MNKDPQKPKLEADLQEQLRQVKHKIFEARQALEKTQFPALNDDGRTDFIYADRHFAVVEQFLNLASLALAEGCMRMQELEIS